MHIYVPHVFLKNLSFNSLPYFPGTKAKNSSQEWREGSGIVAYQGIGRFVCEGRSVVGKYGCNSFGLSLGAAFIKHQGTSWSLWFFIPIFAQVWTDHLKKLQAWKVFAWKMRLEKLQGVLFLRLERIVFCKSLEGLCTQRHRKLCKSDARGEMMMMVCGMMFVGIESSPNRNQKKSIGACNSCPLVEAEFGKNFKAAGFFGWDSQSYDPYISNTFLISVVTVGHLCDFQDIFLEFEFDPVASASIAQVLQPTS